MDNTFYMKRVFRLARKGAGQVSPNPLVGALLVKNDQIISEGFHARFGDSHAEINALSRLTLNEAEGCDLYVNLEPCSFYGKTPPCTDAIIKAKIKRVVIGMTDPNPRVNGMGVQKLKEAGIQIVTGVLKDKCEELNAPFIKYMTKKKPYITIKIAQTLDGKIATPNGNSKWITSEKSRRMVHRMRKENDAVLVGAGTVIHDNPELTVRFGQGKGGKRIVLDSKLRIPVDSKVLHLPDSENTIIATTSAATEGKIEKLKELGIVIWKLKSESNGNVSLAALFKKMNQEEIQSVLVEGGKAIFTSFLLSGETDKLVVFLAPKVFGNGIGSFDDLGIQNPNDAILFKNMKWRKLGNEMIFEGTL